MNNGYIPISRALFDGGNVFWSEEREYSRFEAWLDLIQAARFESGVTRIHAYKSICVQRGQLIGSIGFLSSRWMWGVKKTRIFLDYLESEGMITRNTPKGKNPTVITLCNYDTYNPISEPRGKQKDKLGASLGQVKGNNINKENKVNKEEDITTPNGGSNDLPDGKSSSTTTIHLKTKKRARGKTKVVFDTSSYGLLSGAVNKWLAYKAEIKDTYKSQNSVDILARNLWKLSSGNAEQAMLIVDQSIGNNWKGLFELKNGKGKQQGGYDNKPSAEYKADILRRLGVTQSSGEVL